jgi:hypothetical protein
VNCSISSKLAILPTILPQNKRAAYRRYNLQFPISEFDMVVFDSKNLCCEIYEVKYSKEQVPKQYRHFNPCKKRPGRGAFLYLLTGYCSMCV